MATVAADRTLVSRQTEAYVTKKFRELLLFGNKKEALEWAMTQGLWGHALFLASKMDQRTYSSVMIRFANGLALTDPLQTLYQLMSGESLICFPIELLTQRIVFRSPTDCSDQLR